MASPNDLPYRTYSENIRHAGQEKGLSIRELSVATGYSFEHLRKIWMGPTAKRPKKLSIAKECSDVLCEILGLDSEAMWALAEQERSFGRDGTSPALADPVGQALTGIWPGLDDEQRKVLLRMAQSFETELAHVMG